MAPAPLSLSKIDHMGAPVWDADAAAAFYDHVDAPLVADDPLPEYNVRAVFIDVGGSYVEFLEPTGPSNVKTYLERHGPGFQHVAFRVPDIDSTVEQFRADGIGFQTDEPTAGAGDARIIFVEERHTGGLQYELVERSSPPG
jgi:methylmalonyl-CoA/ethylmalonyl-CoA epimerase